MDFSKTDLLLAYVLAVAGQEEAGNREIGAIHLIKYVYLADLAFAEAHGGKTFTGAPWRFHHFGPWAAEVYQRIEPVVRKVGAREHRISSKFTDDYVRWTLADERLADELDEKVPREISRAVKRAIRKFGSDTSALLDFVYTTAPVLNSGPGEKLEFAIPPTTESEGQSFAPGRDASKADATATSVVSAGRRPVLETSSKAQQRRRKQRLAVLREAVRAKLKALPKGKLAPPTPPPRYDDKYFEGVAWLDDQAGEPIQSERGELMVSKAVWKSRARGDPGLS
jgi:hypothetical protein